MKLKTQIMHRVAAIALFGAAVILPGCGSHEVIVPGVKEESLTPEQKAQFERMKNAQAEAMRKAGFEKPVVMTPQEYALQQVEAHKQAQKEAKADSGEKQGASESPSGQ
ncbi:MAG: hypothetical protein IT366_17490 [Candidatus Hydrogenedentes bacterium]|nr:hypothetical protein [Candidatus Hydrogenedentota bacterium]